MPAVICCACYANLAICSGINHANGQTSPRHIAGHAGIITPHVSPAPPARTALPARDADIGIEAINHGADAVYIGGPAFGARASAGNDIRDIERLVKHAHRFNSRIFITLNTILRDDELEAARQMAWQVYEAGADALIIQDMGLLEIDLPPIQLHASTQTDIRTPEKARFCKTQACRRSCWRAS